ncbi:ABC transporter ATP-binding protein [Breznakiella homolactica]|uniref:ABC transporter ATP-binding protein n=1 Tax=Breznakiella homolactica TaxID=2798577 RepID=UPI001CBA667D|nr:ABC transporter ATP-binding protein [Breznakiella homolactica]
MKQGDTILEFKDYCMGFRIDGETYNLIDRLSFTIREGSVLGVVGESGCGKSMTSLSVMRLLPPEAIVQGGGIFFDSEDLLSKTELEMESIRGRDIAMVFQEPMTSLNPVYTVGRQIGEVFKIHRKDMSDEQIHSAVLDLLSRVGISNPGERINQYPHQLSGGMRQRVMIAMAIACSPRLLIADEPTTALDVTIQAQVLELMQELQAQSRGSIMLITHNLGVVAETCDEVIVMYAGRIVEKGLVTHIFDNPSHPYTQGLIASIPTVSGDSDELYSIPGTVPTIEHFTEGCRFAPRCEHRREECSRGVPPVKTVEPDHEIACWVLGGA